VPASACTTAQSCTSAGRSTTASKGLASSKIVWSTSTAAMTSGSDFMPVGMPGALPAHTGIRAVHAALQQIQSSIQHAAAVKTVARSARWGPHGHCPYRATLREHHGKVFRRYMHAATKATGRVADKASTTWDSKAIAQSRRVNPDGGQPLPWRDGHRTLSVTWSSGRTVAKRACIRDKMSK